MLRRRLFGKVCTGLPRSFSKSKGGTACRAPSQSEQFVLRELSFYHSTFVPQPPSRAPARPPATSAAVAAPIPRHDGSAEAAGGGVAQVDESGESVSGVHGTGRRTSGFGPLVRNRRAAGFSYRFRLRSGTGRPQAEVFEQHPLLAGEETQLQPAEDVVHDGLGEADVGIVGPAAGFEAGVGKLFAEQFQRYAVLQRDGDGQSEAVHQAANRGAFLGHGNEELARFTIGIEPDGDVALVSANAEFVRDGRAL